MNQEPATQHGIRWGIIILDLIILLCLSGILMVLAISIQKIFSVTNDAQALISTIQKGKMENGTDTVFLQALDNSATNDSPTKLANTPDFSGRTPLMWASYTHYNNPMLTYAKDKVRHFYASNLLAVPGINAKAQDNDGWTALHWSSWSGLPTVTNLLIDTGLEINQPEKNGYTPAMLAAMRGNDKALSFLIKAGADLNLKNKDGKSALDLAKQSYAAYIANFDLTKTNVWIPNDVKDPEALVAQDDDEEEHEPGSGRYVDVRGEAFLNTLRLLEDKGKGKN